MNRTESQGRNAWKTQPWERDLTGQDGPAARPVSAVALTAITATATLFAFWLYRDLLTLPNMYDTLLHTQLAEGQTLGSVWLPDDRFGFYRPLVFLPLVLIRLLTGAYPAGLLQGLNLLQHGFNTALVAGLAWRLSHRRWPAMTAGLLFASFPFGFQALAIYGNNAYLTVTGLLLLGLHLWLSGRFQGRLILAAVQLAALLVHEIGVLLVPLIFLVEILRDGHRLFPGQVERQERWRPRMVNLFPTLMAIGFYLGVYPFLPRGGGPLLDFGGNELGSKILIFAQTAAYPLVWPAHLLPHLAAVTIIGAAAAVTVLWVVLAGHTRPSLRRLLQFGLAWWLLHSTLVGVTLPTYYIADGARLLYPGSVGLALVWSVLLSPGTRQEGGFQSRPGVRTRVSPQAINLVLIALVLVTSSRFVRQMLVYYARAGEPVATLMAVLPHRPADEGVLWINPPQWLSPPRNTFAIGTELAPLLGSHLFAAELIAANGGKERPVTVLLAPELRAVTAYHYGLYELTAVDHLLVADLPAAVTHVFITEYGEKGPRTTYRGRLEIGDQTGADRPIIGPFLLESIRAEYCDPETMVEITLSPQGAPPPTLSLFVQTLSADGQLQGQADGPPLGIPAGRITWSPGTHLVGRRAFGTDGLRPAAGLVGAYDFATGKRLGALDEKGGPVMDNAYRFSIQDPGDLCHSPTAGVP